MGDSRSQGQSTLIMPKQRKSPSKQNREFSHVVRNKSRSFCLAEVDAHRSAGLIRNWMRLSVSATPVVYPTAPRKRTTGSVGTRTGATDVPVRVSGRTTTMMSMASTTTHPSLAHSASTTKTHRRSGRRRNWSHGCPGYHRLLRHGIRGDEHRRWS